MNKLFAKIASISVGLSLAVGVGVALGVSKKDAVKASATVAIAYTLDGTVAGSGNTYNGDNTSTQGDVSWIANGNLTTAKWRFGGNQKNGLSTADTVRIIQSQVEVSVQDITKVVVNSSKPSKNPITPTDVSLKVGTAAGGSQTSSLSNGSWASTVTFDRPAGKDWSSKYFEIDFIMPANTTDTNKFIELESIVFYYESTVERGELSISGLDTSLFTKEESKSLTAAFNPLSSGATLVSHEFSSTNDEVLTFSGDTLTAVAPGAAKINLTGVDSNDEEYSVQSSTIFVTNEYSFAIGDTVALYSEGALMELASVNKSGSTHYGEGTAYSTSPNGTYLLTVDEGSADGSLAFVNDGNYLSWASGNSLTTSASVDNNSSWYVVVHDTYTLIVNAATTSREIWWNSGTPRFACYEGKTPTTTGYNSVDLYKIEEAPVRGTISILNSFSSFSREDITGDLDFEFTPASGDSATITSYTWVSSNTDALAISGSHYTGVGTGKVKITLNATDSNGQEYSASTSEFTLLDVVSGSYQKKTSVAVGDTVVIACDTAGTQMAGISSSIGVFVYYDLAPADVCVFTLESGTENDSYALKHDDKYLKWTSDANIGFEDNKTANSSWTISFDDDDAIISCVALDGEDHRSIAWNNKSPRFCAYKSGQTAIQLYGPNSSYEEEVLDFAQQMLDLTCDASGETAPSTSDWADMEDYFVKNVSPEGKLLLKDFKAAKHVSPATDTEKIEAAMDKYDYIIAKYNIGRGLSDDYPDFIERDPKALSNVYAGSTINVDSNSMIIVVTIVVAISITSIGCLLIIKRRKQ